LERGEINRVQPVRGGAQGICSNVKEKSQPRRKGTMKGSEDRKEEAKMKSRTKQIMQTNCKSQVEKKSRLRRDRGA